MVPRVLMIDDDLELLALVQIGLQRKGFVVSTAKSGQEGLQKAEQICPDAVILDLMMPGMDGWATCQQLQQICDAPIIVLTAKTNGQDRAKGSSLGVDAYLTKPCTFAELRACLRRVLPRGANRPPGTLLDVYDDGILRIDLFEGTVERMGEPVDLTATESRLLAHLISRKGQLASCKELLVDIWGPEYAEEVDYLGLYVRSLHQKIEDDPDNPHYVRALWKMGYYFGGNEALVRNLCLSTLR